MPKFIPQLKQEIFFRKKDESTISIGAQHNLLCGIYVIYLYFAQTLINIYLSPNLLISSEKLKSKSDVYERSSAHQYATVE